MPHDTRAPTRWLLGWLAAACLLAASHAGAAEATLDTLADDYRYCTVCHGARLQGNVAIQAPALAGIEAWYLQSRLRAYRAMHLGSDFARDPAGTEMRTVAREIEVERWPAIGAWLARFQRASTQASIAGNAANGRRLYATYCVACHGERAVGHEALLAPELTRLNDWYVVAAFGRYRQRLRGQSEDDVPARQMQAIVAALPQDFAINDIAAWLQSLH